MRMGVDLEQTTRFEGLKPGSAFTRRYFSDAEAKYCFSKPFPHQHLAARFAAKEAHFKATGDKTSFKSIEVENGRGGRPRLLVRGRVSRAQVSLSHSGEYAVAFVAFED